ncbi:MAG: DUF4330 domain-containing protein [Clostridiales bacterium]|jgi:hypothetical protein|nr:DUF4330 domain-containing protein [Clostridiales bacterium]MDR2751023.1 DUF4330 domain-containing protein [Clostridiales bacterium]
MKNRKFVDEKLRLFGVVSIVDILLVCLFAVFIALAIQFSAPQSVAAKAGDVSLEYMIELQKKLPGFADSITIGADLYDSQKGYHIGTIKSVLETDYLEDLPDHNGNIIRRGKIPGFHTIYITVEATAQVTDMATSVGAFDIMVGKEIYVKNKDFASSCYIVKTERGEAQ